MDVIDQKTKVPLPWIVATAAFVLAALPGMVTLKLVDERTKDLPAVLRDFENRIIKLEGTSNDLIALKPAVSKAQTDIAVLQATVGKGTSSRAEEEPKGIQWTPAWWGSVPDGWTLGPDGMLKKL